jgi:hypothetical protein
LIRAMSPAAFWSWLNGNRVPRSDELLAVAAYIEPEPSQCAAPPDHPAANDDPAPVLTSPESVIAPLPELPRRQQSAICRFHHCDPMFCFCWD